MDEIKEDFLKKYVNPEMKVNDWGNFKTEINELLKGFLELILIKDWKTKNDYEHYIENHLKYIHKGVKEIMNKSLKNVGEFIFGRNFTEADASLFAVLIQIFDTAKSLHIDNIFLFRAYKETFMFYVKHVKTKLGLDVEEDKKDKQRHLSLNYEPVNTEDSEYNGPFLLNLPTNFNSFMKYNFEDFQNIFEQTNIDIILNELKKYKFTWNKEENLLLFAKIGMKIKENSNLNLDEENIDYFKGMFLEAIFYICSKCREGFEM
uniref:Uncharacterized protein n=1 Tax=Meloidogyne enterolobii TaxID=390850 RepID=A0A6V7VDR6_MELEN|nr:unnamed protein product [Meloidogyne enterolobii]